MQSLQCKFRKEELCSLLQQYSRFFAAATTKEQTNLPRFKMDKKICPIEKVLRSNMVLNVKRTHIDIYTYNCYLLGILLLGKICIHRHQSSTDIQ